MYQYLWFPIIMVLVKTRLFLMRKILQISYDLSSIVSTLNITWNGYIGWYAWYFGGWNRNWFKNKLIKHNKKWNKMKNKQQKTITTTQNPLNQMKLNCSDFGVNSSPIRLRTYSLVMSSGSSDSNSCYRSSSATSKTTDNHIEPNEPRSPPAWHVDCSR